MEYSLLENMSFFMYASCVFSWLWEGEFYFIFYYFFFRKSFLLIIESYFKGEFMLFMILCYIMQIFICDHEFYLFIFPVPHMPWCFCWVFQVTWNILSICDKKGEFVGRDEFVVSAKDFVGFCSRNCQRGSLLVLIIG